MRLHNRHGLTYGIICHGLWGAFPLYFMQLDFASALEIVAHRVVWSLPVCLILLAIARRLPEFVAVLRKPRQRIHAVAGLHRHRHQHPLIAFGAAAQRLSLTTLGLLQYLSPILQFVVAVVIAGETMSPARWAGSTLIWVALVLVTFGALRTQRRQRQRVTTAPVMEPAG